MPLPDSTMTAGAPTHGVSGTPVNRRRGRRRRFLMAARMVTQVYAGYKGLQLLGKVLAADRVEPLYRRHHRRSAELAYDTATALQGLLIKACQFLRTRAHSLPPE